MSASACAPRHLPHPNPASATALARLARASCGTAAPLQLKEINLTTHDTGSSGACACESPSAPYTLFHTERGLGVDETDGRYAEVCIKRCRQCQHLWLRYAVEYEAFSRSGRWARGLISDADAQCIRPRDAPAHLEALPGYIYGGSYFSGQGGQRSGSMHWGL